MSSMWFQMCAQWPYYRKYFKTPNQYAYCYWL